MIEDPQSWLIRNHPIYFFAKCLVWYPFYIPFFLAIILPWRAYKWLWRGFVWIITGQWLNKIKKDRKRSKEWSGY